MDRQGWSPANVLISWSRCAAPLLAGLSAPQMLSAHVFAAIGASAVNAVWATGTQQVVSGGMLCTTRAAAGFVVARSQLLSGPTS